MYEEIQKNIDKSTQAAIAAKTEAERILLIGDICYWKIKKAEYVNTHTIGEANA